MCLRGVYLLSARRVFILYFYSIAFRTKCAFTVTDMLAAVLNTCTKEELEESDDETALVSPSSVTSEESLERRKVIKNKIMAVGRMARVFALLRFVYLFLIRTDY
jgi:hypothetical protein